MGFFGDVIDNVGTALNLGEFGISEAIAGGNKTSNTGRVAYQNSVVSPVTAAPYAKAISQVNGGGGGTGPVVVTLPIGIYHLCFFNCFWF